MNHTSHLWRSSPLSLDKLFEHQVIKSPDTSALIFNRQHISYQELDHRANRLAHFLLSMGVQPGDIVAIMADRSIEMVVALLAVLKAGAAYLPLDPHLPAARLNFMLEDTSTNIMLTQKIYLASQLISIQRFALDDAAFPVAEFPSTNPLPQQEESGKQLAYVMYTSGSTGKPKGVLVEHLGVVNRMFQMQKSFPLSLGDRVMLKTPFNFDVSVREFFWTLGYGGTLVIAKPQGHKDPEYICQLLAQTNTKVVHFVPSMLGVCLDHPTARIPQNVSYVMCSGEALEVSQVKKFFRQLPGARLDNLYGPTEASIEVSEFNCADLAAHDSVPIGKAIENTELLILTKSLELCAVGERGDLYIGGICLARGYLNRDELTEQQFIRHPFSQDKSARLYRTGDQARLLADGNIAFLGRQDLQVSLNGHRIELMEIQNCITKLKGINNAVVTLWDGGLGAQQLIAYLLVSNPVKEQKSIIINNVRQSLQQQLPDYMLPSLFTLLDHFPLSANGKIDRQALPAPTLDFLTDCVPPTSMIEKKLHNLWAKHLLIDSPFGIQHTFIELGGHSVAAIKLISELNQEFATSISLADIFEMDTIAKQSQLIATRIEHPENSVTHISGTDEIDGARSLEYEL